MLKNANYIYDNNIIADGKNTTKDFCKKAQVGVDLTVKRVFVFTSRGSVGKATYLPNYMELQPYTHGINENINDGKEYWNLLGGDTYIIELNEGVKLSSNETGFMIMRSSLNRCGVRIDSCVWDPGYSCESKNGIKPASVRLTVDNAFGFKLYKNSRICQFIVAECEESKLYNGQWQGGNNKL